LCQEIPLEQTEWVNIVEKNYLPKSKMLMESSKLTKAVTLKDNNNILKDVLARMKFKAMKHDKKKIADLIN
jgi:hypothetical protein